MAPLSSNLFGSSVLFLPDSHMGPQLDASMFFADFPGGVDKLKWLDPKARRSGKHLIFRDFFLERCSLSPSFGEFPFPF